MKSFFRVFILLFLINSFLYAKYDFYYRGFKIAEIDTFDTIHQTYIKAKVTSPIFRLITGEPYVIYYNDYKPESKDTKFRRDWQMYFTVLRILIEERPSYQELLVNDENHAFIVCEDNICIYKYYEIDKLIGNGIVVFDENDKIFSITDKVNHAKLISVD